MTLNAAYLGQSAMKVRPNTALQNIDNNNIIYIYFFLDITTLTEFRSDNVNINLICFFYQNISKRFTFKDLFFLNKLHDYDKFH